jgi:RNA polymerase sigma factor (sigma-70 family)
MVDEAWEHSYPVSHRIVSSWASWAVFSRGLHIDLRPDLEQHLMLRLWSKWQRFDAQRACWRTFAERVTANEVISFFRLYTSQTLRQEVPMDDLEPMLAAPVRDVDLRDDVRRVLALLSPFDRAVAVLLTDCSRVETSCILGVSRASVYRAIGRIRAAFLKTGLCPDCTPSSSHD